MTEPNTKSPGAILLAIQALTARFDLLELDETSGAEAVEELERDVLELKAVSKSERDAITAAWENLCEVSDHDQNIVLAHLAGI